MRKALLIGLVSLSCSSMAMDIVPAKQVVTYDSFCASIVKNISNPPVLPQKIVKDCDEISPPKLQTAKTNISEQYLPKELIRNYTKPK